MPILRHAWLIAAGIVSLAIAIGVAQKSDPPEFVVPDKEKRSRAIGDVPKSQSPLREAVIPHTEDFSPIEAPGASDWLASRQESGQTFLQFLRVRRNLPGRERNTIYFMPLGKFEKGNSPSLPALEAFCKAFFRMPVKVTTPHMVSDKAVRSRRNPHNGGHQLLTRDLLTYLGENLPEDAYCMLGITMDDLYPSDDWNYVFGQATLSRRVGVFSFARYDPAFFGEEMDDAEEEKKLVLMRSCKVLAHETGHMFGIRHCIYFRCLMNGSNHLAEADSRPPHLCPVCLRKLHSSKRFDVPKRYVRLETFFRKHGFDDEADWALRRVRRTTPDL